MAIITKVIWSKKFLKQRESLPPTIRQKLLGWIFLVERNGIHEVSKSKGLHDEPLKGSRWGQRSIRLNRSYRLIYRIIEDHILIELLEVHKHDY